MEITTQWGKALEPNILGWTHEGFATYSDGTAEVFNIFSESAAIYRFHDSWGPKQIAKSTEGAATPELSRQKGHGFVAFVKSLLIDLEVLIKKDNRAEGESHRERLSEETTIFGRSDSLNFANI